MATRRTIHLLETAATYVKENAACLKDSHTVNGVWVGNNRADTEAMIIYLHDIRLAKALRLEATRLKEKLHVV